MHARLLADMGRDCRNTSAHYVLSVRLARINHVVNSCACAKAWQNILARLAAFDWLSFCGCNPGDVSVRVRAKWLVVKIQIKLSEFPELICDVFARVSDSAVRANDYLIGFVLVSSSVGLKGHHPTASISSFRLTMNCTCLLHSFERMIPEFQTKNFRLAREHIVANAKTLHCV